jgi:hypothetical protein
MGPLPECEFLATIAAEIVQTVPILEGRPTFGSEVDLSLGVGRPADESGNDDWELVQRGNLNPD